MWCVVEWSLSASACAWVRVSIHRQAGLLTDGEADEGLPDPARAEDAHRLAVDVHARRDPFEAEVAVAHAVVHLWCVDAQAESGGPVE